MRFRRLNRWALLVTALCLLLFCSAFAIWSGAVWPKADGDRVVSDDSLKIDYSHAKQGYIMIKGAKTSKKQKLQIKFGSNKLTYDINSNGTYEVFPLQFGSGSYTIVLYKNTSGKQYAQIGSRKISVTLDDEQAAFLVPNQYVNYSKDDPIVALSDEICRNCTTDAEKLQAVRDYFKKNFHFDYVRMMMLKSGDLPDINYVLKNKMGVCQDLSAVACAILRTQGVKTRFCIGYFGSTYHAWLSVFIDGKEVIYDPTYELGGISKNGTYQEERFY